jgi:hypothetical protein
MDYSTCCCVLSTLVAKQIRSYSRRQWKIARLNEQAIDKIFVGLNKSLLSKQSQYQLPISVPLHYFTSIIFENRVDLLYNHPQVGKARLYGLVEEEGECCALYLDRAHISSLSPKIVCVLVWIECYSRDIYQTYDKYVVAASLRFSGGR